MCWVFFIFLFIKCTNSNSQPDITLNQNKTSKKVEKKDAILPLITYLADSIPDTTAWRIFKSKYDTSQLKIIAAINRIDLSKIRIGSKLIIPDTIFKDFDHYVPFPQHLALPDSVPKFIMVNQRIQIFAAYENGILVHTGPVSTGRKAKPTPNKLYYTNYKARLKTSTVDGSWKMPWYFNISNRGGIGMHQYTLPGYPASHSCIRMYEENANWIYNWAQPWTLTSNQNTILVYGTPVLVFGNYDFSQPPIWKTLPQNPHALELTSDELQVINESIPKIKIHP